MANLFTSEQIFLSNFAKHVWAGIGAAKRVGLPLNEETITEILLLDLVLNFPGHVKITAFNKIQEARLGADWAWNFQSADGKWNQPMLVQAKRLSRDDKEYKSIDQLIGKRKLPPAPSQQSQIDVLIKVANILGFPSVYFFYNHLSDPSRVPNNCGSFNPIYLSFFDYWGVSFAHAKQVKAMLPDKTFDTHSNYSLPFHCLLCSGGLGLKHPKGSAGAAASALNRLSSIQSSFIDATVEVSIIEPKRELHQIFRYSEIDEFDEKTLSTIRRDYPGVGGVVILRDKEE